MKQVASLAIVGDFDPSRRYHLAANEAVQHAAGAAGIDVLAEWVPTQTVAEAGVAPLARFDAIWAAPGSPYRSEAGVLAAIRFARETGRPFVGT